MEQRGTSNSEHNSSVYVVARGSFFELKHKRHTRSLGSSSSFTMGKSKKNKSQIIPDGADNSFLLLESEILTAMKELAKFVSNIPPVIVSWPGAGRHEDLFVWNAFVNSVDRCNNAQDALLRLESIRDLLPVFKELSKVSEDEEYKKTVSCVAHVYSILQLILEYMRLLSKELSSSESGDDLSNYKSFSASMCSENNYFGDSVPSHHECCDGNPWLQSYQGVNHALCGISNLLSEIKIWLYFSREPSFIECDGLQEHIDRIESILSDESKPWSMIFCLVKSYCKLDDIFSNYYADCQASLRATKSTLSNNMLDLFASACEIQDSMESLDRYEQSILIKLKYIEDNVNKCYHPDYIAIINSIVALRAIIQHRSDNVAISSGLLQLCMDIGRYINLCEKGYFDRHLYCLGLVSFWSSSVQLPESLHQVRLSYCVWLMKMRLILGNEELPHEHHYANVNKQRRSSDPDDRRNYNMNSFLMTQTGSGNGSNNVYQQVWQSPYAVPRYLCYLSIFSTVLNSFKDGMRYHLGVKNRLFTDSSSGSFDAAKLTALVDQLFDFIEHYESIISGGCSVLREVKEFLNDLCVDIKKIATQPAEGKHNVSSEECEEDADVSSSGNCFSFIRCRRLCK